METIRQLEETLDDLWTLKKSFSALKNYLKDQDIPYISSGSSRWVFGPIDGHVLKLAKNRKGIAQNNAEADGLINNYDCICEWFAASDEGIWIESDYCTKAKPTDFKKILGYPFSTHCEYLEYMEEERSKNPGTAPDGYYELLEDEDNLLCSMYYLISDFDLPVGDFQRISSYGVNSEGKIALVDYGLNRQVGKDHYSNFSITL